MGGVVMVDATKRLYGAAPADARAARSARGLAGAIVRPNGVETEGRRRSDPD